MKNSETNQKKTSAKSIAFVLGNVTLDTASKSVKNTTTKLITRNSAIGTTSTWPVSLHPKLRGLQAKCNYTILPLIVLPIIEVCNAYK